MLDRSNSSCNFYNKEQDKYKNKDDFLLIPIENYDDDIWEISDIDELMLIFKKFKLDVIKERFFGRFSTYDFWYNTITA